MLKRVLILFSFGFIFGSCSSPEQRPDKMVNFRNVKYDPTYILKEISTALELDPQNASHYYKRSQYYLEAKLYKAALKDIDQAIALDSEKGEYYFRKALVLRSQGNYKTALQAAVHAEELKFRSTELDILLGELYLFSKEFDLALQYLNDALEETPENEYIYFYRGLAQAQTGDSMAAIRNFKSALKRSPDLVESYNQLIKIYLAQKNLDQAAHYLRAGQKQDSVNAYLWYYQGELHQTSKHPDSAYFSYKNAVKYDSLLYLAHYKLSLHAFEKNKYQEAASEMEKAIKGKANLPLAHILLGESYEKTGKLEKALPHYQWVYKREPQNLKAMWGVRRTMYQLYKINRDSLKQDERKKRDSLLAIFRQRQVENQN